MAQDYFTSSLSTYDITTGVLTGSFDTVASSENIGGTATDDNTWDVGDPILDGNTIFYQGSFTANGHLFLVFENTTSGFTTIRSTSAPANDPGYPPNVGSIPSLNTDPLAFCFCAGSEITTPDGSINVEDLRIDDTILTAEGRQVPVKWVGRQTLCKISHGPHMQPVRIRAGALGHGLPLKDLTVTADHGMIIDGYVINAGALVNGNTIDFVPLKELAFSFTVYHVETENHDVILASGAQAETFVNAVTRKKFDNHDEYLALYGAERMIREMDRPRISSPRMLPESVKGRLGVQMSSGLLKESA